MTRTTTPDLGSLSNLVPCHHGHGQRSRERYELRIVSGQSAVGDNVEHEVVGDDVFAFGERFIRNAQYSNDLHS